MQIRFEDRDSFRVFGYAIETILSSCDNDVGQLWEKHKDALLALPESKSCLYGVMWYTESHKYFYHLGISSDTPFNNDMTVAVIPTAHFAVATVPDGMDTVEAWTLYFEKELPSLGCTPDAEHGMYFESYRADGICELWTPVIQSNPY